MVDFEGNSRSIEDIEVGDYVLARSEFDAAGPLELKRVEEKFVRVAPVMELVVRGQAITTTAEHPFFVAGEERFVPAGELKPEDQLVDSQGRSLAIDAIRVTDRLITVYNLRVADFHTYFVGGKLWKFDAWVHNAGQIDYVGGVKAPRGPVQSQHFSTSVQGRALHESAQSYREAAKLGPYRNVATADVTVDGVRKTVRFKNDPDAMHSEQRLVAWHKLMTERGKKVDVHGVYSERPPCGPMSANCRETLGNYFGQFLDVWHGNR